MNLSLKQISRVVISVLTSACLFASCLKGNESESIVTDYDNALISAFSLDNNNNVCSSLYSYGFTIDHLGCSDEALIERCSELWKIDEYTQVPGIIFNPDSLPVGTEPDSIKISITTDNASSIEVLQYDEELRLKKYTNYKDTQVVWFDDYAVTRILVAAQDGVTNKSYFVKVNVHKCESDTIRWKYLAKDLFDMSQVIDQRVDTIGTTLYWYTTLSDQSQQVRQADLLGNVAQWSDPAAVSSPAPIVLNTMLNWQDKIYAVGSDGQLLSTSDGTTWTSQSSAYSFVSIVGYQLATPKQEEHLCAIANISGQNQFVRSTDGSDWSIDTLIINADTTSIVPDNFPITGFTRPMSKAAKPSSGSTTSRIYITGGVMADGQLTSSTWSSDGYQWAEFTQVLLPPMKNASVVRYTLDKDNPDTFWIMQPGEMANGYVCDSLYYSENSGVTWKKLMKEHMKLADLYRIDPFGGSSAFFNPVSYRIYFIGGKNSEGKQQSNIVSGVLPNLSFLKKK